MTQGHNLHPGQKWAQGQKGPRAQGSQQTNNKQATKGGVSKGSKGSKRNGSERGGTGRNGSERVGTGRNGPDQGKAGPRPWSAPARLAPSPLPKITMTSGRTIISWPYKVEQQSWRVQVSISCKTDQDRFDGISPNTAIYLVHL